MIYSTTIEKTEKGLLIAGILLGAVLQEICTAIPLFVFLFVFGIGTLVASLVLKWGGRRYHYLLFSDVRVIDVSELMWCIIFADIAAITSYYVGKTISAIVSGCIETGTCFLSAILSELWLWVLSCLFILSKLWLWVWSSLQAAYPAVLLALGLLAVFVAVVEASLRKR